MDNSTHANASTGTWSFGVDVGTRSMGLAAVHRDESGLPVAIHAQTFIHDSGVDPEQQKTAQTRLATAGVARRVRRMRRRERQRLQRLDDFITAQGWPLVNLEDEADPFLPWAARAQLATSPVQDMAELDRLVSIALRHMARHRGWRNPYVKTRSLLHPADPSDQFLQMRERAEQVVGEPLPEEWTTAQLVMAADPAAGTRLRQNSEKPGLLGGKLMQTDNVAEMRRWWDVQPLPPELFGPAVEAVFTAKSPAGSAAERVGKDPLPGQRSLPRAPRASLDFQRYRLASILTNLRIGRGNAQRRLTRDELSTVFAFLAEQPSNDKLTWVEVAELLDISRAQLVGTAGATEEGERSSARPPIIETHHGILNCKIKPIVAWWKTADDQQRDLLVDVLSHGVSELTDHPGGAEVADLIDGLSEDDLAKLDSVRLPSGRAAYSRDSLRRLADRMLADGVDVHEARKREFGVDDTWTPPADPIGAPIGNPAVDRVVKEFARWLEAAIRVYGMPTSLNIEHVRSALGSEKVARERDRENDRRHDRNRQLQERIRREMGGSGPTRASDVRKYLSFTRQNGQCAYCGEPITFTSAEMDHIVPRKGVGSTNAGVNLVAVCRTCNQSKSNTPFAVWAARSTIPGVGIEEAVGRVRHWVRDSGSSAKDFSRFQREVVSRLRQTVEDPEIDARSMESVAWMATELRRRIAYAYPEIKVAVYRGQLTHEARLAGELENRLPYIGGAGKTRLDRRHHAVDAAVTAIMRQSVAKTLKERIDLRNEMRLTGRDDRSWRDHEGSSPQLYRDWKRDMWALGDLLIEAMEQDRIPVRSNIRLRLGNGRAHDDTINKLARQQVGSALSPELIDRASTPALWCALTRHPDYDPKLGLPEDAQRRIRVRDKHLDASDEVSFFTTPSAAIEVRGGWAAIGGTIHHARIYRLPGKKPSYGMVRVFTVDLLRHRDEDLFAVELPPQSISMRTAEPKVRAAVSDGTAEYLGWIVEGDEVRVDLSGFGNVEIGRFRDLFPAVRQWRVSGFYSNSQLRLRPSLLAGEGLAHLPEDNLAAASKDVQAILVGKGWRPSTNVFFGQCRPVVIRRDVLGVVRLESGSGLPVSWMAG